MNTMQTSIIHPSQSIAFKAQKLWIFRQYMLSFFLLATLTLSAQVENPSLETSQVEVVRTFEAILDDAQILPIRPTIPPINIIKRQYSYDITIVPLPIKYPDPILRPLAMKPDSPFPNYPFYAKVGFGNLSNPVAQIRYALNHGDEWNLKTHLDYQALDNSDNQAFQKYSSIKAGAEVQYRMSEKYQVLGGVDFSRDNRFFYFTPRELRPEQNEDSLRRNITTIGAHIGISNIEPNPQKIDYRVVLSNHLTRSTNLTATENQLSLDAIFAKRNSEKINIEFPIQAALVSYSNIDQNPSQSLGLFRFNPRINFQSGNFQLNLGAALLLTSDQTFAFPTAQISIGMFGNQAQVFAGADQNYVINGLRHSLQVSPWMDNQIDSVQASVSHRVFGGIRGEFSFISYQAKAGYMSTKNQPLYIHQNEFGFVNQFYEDLSTVFINGNLDFAFSDVLTLGGATTINYYTLNQADEPWGLPAFELKSYANFTLWSGKLKINNSLHFSDRVSTINNDGEVIRLNNQIDLTTGFELWPSKNIAIFGNANNILNNKYVRWYGHPVVGIHFQGGIVLKF